MAEKRKLMLGMSIGKANAILLRSILYQLVCEAGRNTCHQCGLPILREKELSIEHKESWQLSGDPVSLFFDLSNISFSHRACNYRAAFRQRKYHSEEARAEAQREQDTARKRAVYTRERRQKKYRETGH